MIAFTPPCAAEPPSTVISTPLTYDAASDSRYASYPTRHALVADATVKAPRGRRVTLTVDGTATAITPGKTCTGACTLTVA